MTAFTPGRYLRVRREIAGVSLQSVAEHFDTTPRISELERVGLLKLIEADTHEVTIAVAGAYRGASVAIDMDILVMLVPPLPPTPPRLCRGCASGDRQIRGGLFGSARHWVEADLCSSCCDAAQPSPRSEAA